jgi:HNH endonuclease
MIILRCKQCKKTFEVKPYRAKRAIACSRSCLWILTKHLREPKRLNKIIGKRAVNNNQIKHKCRHCSKQFYDSPSRKRKYCSKFCVNKQSKKTWKAVFSTVRKNMVRRGMFEKCQECGFNECKEILGVHHIDENRHNNKLSNLIVLCPNCHSMKHRMHIPH